MKKPVQQPPVEQPDPSTEFTPPSSGGDFIFDPVSGKAVPVPADPPKVEEA